MTSPEKIAANRRNAARSTGPVTPAGRAAAARNAITHGLLARDTVLPEEKHQDLERLVNAWLDQFQPAGAAIASPASNPASSTS